MVYHRPHGEPVPILASDDGMASPARAPPLMGYAGACPLVFPALLLPQRLPGQDGGGGCRAPEEMDGDGQQEEVRPLAPLGILLEVSAHVGSCAGKGQTQEQEACSWSCWCGAALAASVPTSQQRRV